jgi:hypothetical protein
MDMSSLPEKRAKTFLREVSVPWVGKIDVLLYYSNIKAITWQKISQSHGFGQNKV